MTHKSTALQIAGRTVRLVNLNNRLYVPMRFLVEDTLGMRWDGQRKRLASMAARWKMADLLVAGQRKTVQQPCLPVGMVLPYLWMIRPAKPEIINTLERLRDRWDESLLAYLKFDGSELANIGSFLFSEIERSMAPLVAQIDELKKKVAEAKRPILNVVDKPITARWEGNTTGANVFLEMARLNNDGLTNNQIAERLQRSRTMVSLFLDGKYQSGTAKDAWTKLKADGWEKTNNTPPS